MKNKKFDFNSEKLKFNKGDIEVLKKLYIFEFGLDQKELLKGTGIKTKGGISKILKRLKEQFGLVYDFVLDVNTYRIVPERRREVGLFLKAYKKGYSRENLFCCHAYIIKCPVNKLPELFLNRLIKTDGWLEYVPKNWAGYKKSYIDATIKFHKTNNQCSAYFFFRSIANNPYVAEMINIQKFLEKKSILETKYPGLKLGDPTIVGFQDYCEVSWLIEPSSVEAIKLGLKHSCVEDSYKIGGEWEEKGSNAVEKIGRIFELRDLIKDFDDNKFKRAIKYLRKLSSQG